MARNSTTKCPMSMATPATMSCPFAAYDNIREEKAIYVDPLTHFRVVTRYADIRAIAENPNTFSSRTGLLGSGAAETNQTLSELYRTEGFEHLDTLVTNDPPSHTRYRSLVDKAFNALRVRAAEATILNVTNTLIDAFPNATFDFVSAFAIPLPVRMIASQLGVAPLLSELANSGSNGERLSERELVSILQQLLVAGNETTTNAITAAVLRLADDLALQDTLRNSPELIRVYCEEVLRLDAPLQGLFRIATKDTQVGETSIPSGTILDLRWGAGNRDPLQYTEPEKIDLQRKSATQHLTFGYGIHSCIGHLLARAEMRIAMTQLLARSKSIKRAKSPDAVVRKPHFIAYGIERLMVDITKV